MVDRRVAPPVAFLAAVLVATGSCAGDDRAGPSGPKLPPPEHRIVFTRDGVVWVTSDVGDRPPVRLGEGADPSWAPGGRRLVLRGPSGSLVEHHVSDGSRNVLVAGGPENLGSATWAPDGRRLAYTRGGEVVVRSRRRDTERVVASFATGMVRVLDWAPDGERLLVSRQFGTDTALHATYLVDVADGEQVELLPATGEGGGARFSPTGTHIAFFSNDVLGGGTACLCVVAVDGTGVRALETYRGPRRSIWPAWSPDGTEVLSASEFGGEVQVSAADGSGIRVTYDRLRVDAASVDWAWP